MIVSRTSSTRQTRSSLVAEPVPRTVRPPASGLWRVGRAGKILDTRQPQPMPADQPGAGNRFDSLAGNYATVYCATTREGCYAEVLARFRPDPKLADLVRGEWDGKGWMRVGNVPRSWRESRRAGKVIIDPEAPPFLDVESGDSRAFLEQQLRIPLTYFGVAHLDVPVVRGEDRRVTRLISQWAWAARADDGAPAYGGIRYLSKLDTEFELWAVFDDVESRLVEQHQPSPKEQALRRILDRFGLVLH